MREYLEIDDGGDEFTLNLEKARWHGLPPLIKSIRFAGGNLDYIEFYGGKSGRVKRMHL